MRVMLMRKLKNVYHILNAILASIWYGFPSRKIFVIGVTGTNGKTTTAHLIANLLENSGAKIALASTISFWLGEEKKVNDTKFTTLSAWKLQEFLAKAVDQGCEYAVMETSSHALDQRRVWKVQYDLGVITNVTREHLDYHVVMADYRRAKRRLFEILAQRQEKQKLIAGGRKRESGLAVVNLDMENPKEFILGANKKKIFAYTTRSKKSVESLAQEFNLRAENIIQAQDLMLESDQSSFRVKKTVFNFHLPGRFNVENALAAVGVGKALKLDQPIIQKTIAEFQGIPGRLEEVPNDKGLRIMVDYALTPDSMGKVGRMLRESLEDSNRLFWVFGSCGERDRGKRPLMGAIGAKYADVVMITNEDPYHEDPQQIIDEVFTGVIKNPGKREEENAFRIMDRREALKKSLKMAQPGDLILVTGKGAEENMKIGDKLIEWNDRRVVEELLRELG